MSSTGTQVLTRPVKAASSRQGGQTALGQSMVESLTCNRPGFEALRILDEKEENQEHSRAFIVTSARLVPYVLLAGKITPRPAADRGRRVLTGRYRAAGLATSMADGPLHSIRRSSLTAEGLAFPSQQLEHPPPPELSPPPELVHPPPPELSPPPELEFPPPP